MTLKDKVALITGGSRGIGRAIAEAFARVGATVVICGRKLYSLEQVALDNERMSGSIVPIQCNVTRLEEMECMVETILQEQGRIDILVNNAGATWGAPAEDHPLEAWDKVMNLNVRSLFLMSQAVGRASMIPNRHGRIINLASIAGLSGSARMQYLAYGTSKGAVVNFTRSLAGEWGRYGITVNALAPGFFPSKMTRGTLEAVGAERLAAMAPLGRIGDDDDLKGAAVLFASAAGKHITGQILAVDGGVSAVHGE